MAKTTDSLATRLSVPSRLIFFIVLQFLFSLLLPYPLVALGKSEETVQKLSGSYSVVGKTTIRAGFSFPPFANERQRAFTFEKMEELSIDRLRIAIDWRDREPEQGSFFWEPMDKRMQAAKDHNIKVFLTIASVGPPWAVGKQPNLFNEDALATFFTEILTRYDSIHMIQFGNEWEAGSDGYTDWPSIQKFVHYTNMLYDEVQRLCPQTKVVLGGITRLYPIHELRMQNAFTLDLSQLQLTKHWSQEKLLQRIERDEEEYKALNIKAHAEYVFEHANYDVLDIHLYDDGENWEAYLSIVPKEVPIVVSEFGGPSSEFERTDPSYHATRMEAYLDAIEKLPITEAYYFKLVDSPESYHKHSGLYTKRLKRKPAYTVFKERLSPRT